MRSCSSALTLQPAIVGLVGTRVATSRVPWARRPAADEPARPTTMRRWAELVTRHAAVFLAAAVLVLLVLAIPVFKGDLRLGPLDNSLFPTDSTQYRAWDVQSQQFGPGSTDPFLVVVEIPSGDTSAQAEVTTLIQDVQQAEGVAAVTPPQVSSDDSLAVFEVIPTTGAQAEATADLVTRLRDDTLPQATQGTDLTALVTGKNAVFVDLDDRIADRLPQFIGLVVLVAVVILAAVFRSLAIPIKAAIFNILTILATYGVLVAFLTFGWGRSWIGIPHDIPVLSLLAPVFFAVLFGLSNDYEVYLVSRMHEERDHGADAREAVRAGMGGGGRIVIAAALDHGVRLRLVRVPARCRDRAVRVRDGRCDPARRVRDPHDGVAGRDAPRRRPDVVAGAAPSRPGIPTAGRAAAGRLGDRGGRGSPTTVSSSVPAVRSLPSTGAGATLDAALSRCRRGRTVHEARRVVAADAVVPRAPGERTASPAVVTGAGSRTVPTAGRAAELALFVRWLELAAGGEPRIGIVHGEAGVGKSHLLRAAAAEAQSRGFRVLRASAFEGTPPLLPVLTALAPLIEEARRGRRPDLIPGEVEALELLFRAEVGEARPAAPRASTTRPATWLRSTCSSGRRMARPLFIAIDQADALDDASATLLAHVVSAAVDRSEELPVPLVTVFATRGGGRPAVRRALERLRDEPGCTPVRLECLDEVALNELLTSLGPASPSRPLLREIRSSTGGNPLHARLLWAHLVETGGAVAQDGHVVLREAGAASAARLGLGDVIDVRLEVLSPTCRDLLQVASVLGPTGDIAAVAEVTGTTPDTVAAALAEASAAGVCDAGATRYRFDHPLLSAALNRSLTSARRRQLQLAFAGVVARRSPPSPLDVARRLQAAGDLAPVEDRRRWGVAAAERAADLGAWGDAVAAYELALGDGGDEGFDDEQLLGLYTGAAVASAADHDVDSCERFARPGVALARERRDLERWCAMVVQLAHARVRVVRGAATRRWTRWRSSSRPPATTSRTCGRGPRRCWPRRTSPPSTSTAGSPRPAGPGRWRKPRATTPCCPRCCSPSALQHQGRFELDDSDWCFETSIAHGERAGAAATAWSRARLPSARWLRGDLAGARNAARDAEEAASRRSDWAELSLVVAWSSAIAVAAGRFDDAVALAERAMAVQRRCDYAFTPLVAQPPRAIARAMLGDVAGAHRSLDEWRSAHPSRWIDRLDRLVDALAGASPDGPVAAPAPAGADGDARAARPAPSVAAVRRARGAGRGAGRRSVRPAPRTGAPGARGPAPARGPVRAGEPVAGGAAVRHVCGLRRAMPTAPPAGGDRPGTMRPPQAPPPRRLAATSTRGSSCSPAAVIRDTADHLLTDACTAFDQLGMLPFLRRAEAALGTAGVRHGQPRPRRVILFTDLVESTSLNAAEGDEVFLQLMRVHDRLVRSSLRRHDGVEFKHTGDGLAAWFRSPRQAVRCALEPAGRADERAARQLAPRGPPALRARRGGARSTTTATSSASPWRRPPASAPGPGRAWCSSPATSPRWSTTRPCASTSAARSSSRACPSRPLCCPPTPRTVDRTRGDQPCRCPTPSPEGRC